MMRKSTMEEMRRTIGRAISMCEHSSLGSTKRNLLAALRELDMAEAKESKKSTPAERAPVKFPDPAASLSLLDAEIRKEMGSLDDGKDQLISE